MSDQPPPPSIEELRASLALAESRYERAVYIDDYWRMAKERAEAERAMIALRRQIAKLEEVQQ